ncbi:MAG: cation diffusion facilitator family transporter [Flavobacteriales bacterium]|nr:cation diffusion facilitator family transporter [Flavobacteriales bacterium]
MTKNAQSETIRATWISILGNFLLAVIKWIAGFFGNSYALIADAIESTTDIFSSFLVLIGLRYAHKPADSNHPYGHGRIEPLVTFIVVGFLVTSALWIAHDAWVNINTPHSLPETYTLFVLGGIVLIKEVYYRFIAAKSEKTHSSALKADAWHHRSDAITSLAAFIGISVALLLGEGYESADDYAAILASLFILYNSYQIFRPALGEIMDEHLYHDMIEEIRLRAKEVDGVVDTEKCHIRKAGMNYFVDLHLMVDAKLTVREGHEIAHRLKDHVMSEMPHVADVLVHVEPA